MRAKPRNNNSSLSDKKSMTRHFYLKNEVFDKLVKESADKDVNVSKLLQDKLNLLEEIRFLILREEKHAAGD